MAEMMMENPAAQMGGEEGLMGEEEMVRLIILFAVGLASAFFIERMFGGLFSGHRHSGSQVVRVSWTDSRG